MRKACFRSWLTLLVLAALVSSAWGLANIARRKTYVSGEIFTAVSYVADLDYWIAAINLLNDKFPGETVTTTTGAIDTLTAATLGKVMVKVPLVSLAPDDSLFYHLARIIRLNVSDTLAVGGSIPLTGGFRVAFTAGVRARANLWSVDSLRIVDSLDIAAGAKVYSRANIKAESLSVGSGPIVGFRVVNTASIRERSNLLDVDSLRVRDSLLVAGTAKFEMLGSSSGAVRVKPAAAAGTWTWTLPATAGTTGYPLTNTDGAGTSGWSLLTVPGGGLGVATLASNGVLYGNGAGVVQVTAAGGAGTILTTNTAGLPVFSSSPSSSTRFTTPTLRGGTTATSTLTLQSTGGVGTSDAIVFKTGNNGGTIGLTVNTGGSVTNVMQPAFMVTNSTAGTDVTGDNTTYVLPWDTEVKDQAGNFSGNTFTAPVTGTYLFVLSVPFLQIGVGHTLGYVQLITSNRNFFFTLNPSLIAPGGTDPVVMTVTAIVDMDANDTVTTQAQINNSTKTVDIPSSAGATRFFSGVLLN